MSKIPFSFHVVPVDWGQAIPDCDFTIGRGADPRINSSGSGAPSAGADRLQDDRPNDAAVRPKPRSE